MTFGLCFGGDTEYDRRLLKRLALFSGVKGRRTDRRREGLRLYVSSMPWVCVLEVIGITNRRLLNRLAFFFRGPSQNSRADVSQSIQCLQSILAAKSISYKASTAQWRQSEQSKNDQMFCWSSRAGHANQVYLKNIPQKSPTSLMFGEYQHSLDVRVKSCELSVDNAYVQLYTWQCIRGLWVHVDVHTWQCIRGLCKNLL